MESFSVDASLLEMCSAVMNLTCIQMVLIKRILLMNIMSTASVISLYLSRVVIGMGKNSPLMYDIFVLGYFLSSIQDFPPKCLQLL